MNAVILAAGRGSRLTPHTDTTPKSLLLLDDETTLIHRTIELLKDAGVKKIGVVVGYLKETFFSALSKEPVTFFINDGYAETDQGASLLAAEELLKDDFIVLTADLYGPRNLFRAVMANKDPLCIAIETRKNPFDDSMEKVCLENGNISKIGRLDIANEIAQGEFLGLTKVSQELRVPFLSSLHESLSSNKKAAIFPALQRLLTQGRTVHYIDIQEPWCEVDNMEGLEKARRLYQEEKTKEKTR